MAYTYDDFVSAANKAGLLGQFSQSDLDITKKSPEYGLSLLGLKQDEAKATTAEQRLLATEAANQLRNTYDNFSSSSGWNGGYNTQINDLLSQSANYGSFNYEKDGEYQKLLNQAANYGPFNYGSETAYKNAMDQVANYGSFQYGNADAYQNLLNQIKDYGPFSYGNETAYQKLLNGVTNQQPFHYDLESDPSWGSYKKAYLREGDRASANALAQASAASGGRVSSYAATAAQQAGNYYAGQLSDIIPTLQQNAYQKYLSDFSNRLSALSALENDRTFGYQNYLDQFNQLQTGLGALENDRAFAYQNYLAGYDQLQNNLNNLAADRNFEYQAYLNNLSQIQSALGAMQNDRAFDYESWANQYNMLQNALGNYQQQDATEYQRYLDSYSQAYQAQMDAYNRAYQIQQDTYNREQDALAQQQIQFENEQAAKQQALAQQQTQYENEQAAKQQAFNNALSLYKAMGYATPEIAEILGIQPGSPSGIPDTVLSVLKGRYPNGTVSNQIEWNLLVEQYGEDVLKAAGYTFGGSEGEDLDVDMNSVSALGYGDISESELNGLVRSGKVEEYVEGNTIKFRNTSAGVHFRDIMRKHNLE